MHDQFVFPNQDARRFRMSHQCIEGRQLMIQARAQKPDRQNKWGRNVAQCFVKIGAVLFTDQEQSLWRDAILVGRRQAVKITDHNLRHMPRSQREPRTTVRRDQVRRVA